MAVSFRMSHREELIITGESLDRCYDVTVKSQKICMLVKLTIRIVIISAADDKHFSSFGKDILHGEGKVGNEKRNEQYLLL